MVNYQCPLGRRNLEERSGVVALILLAAPHSMRAIMHGDVADSVHFRQELLIGGGRHSSLGWYRLKRNDLRFILALGQ